MEAAAAMHLIYTIGGNKAAKAENIKLGKRPVKIRAVYENRKLFQFKNNKPTYGSFPLLKAGVGGKP